MSTLKNKSGLTEAEVQSAMEFGDADEARHQVIEEALRARI
ncbi:hypothetical protein QO003_002495 [Arthrobacter silviterrae]|nr:MULTISPECIES: hypothetical protein [Arthrobacter]MDQ0278192.1 hypothetical protein [Arthrobacter silviterrae]